MVGEKRQPGQEGWGRRFGMRRDTVRSAGYPHIAELVGMAAVTAVLPDVEACARELRATKRDTVKHHRGTHIFDVATSDLGSK